MALKASSRYTDLLEPGSLAGVNTYARAHKLSNKQALKELEPELSYTLHKPARRRFPTLPTKVFSAVKRNLSNCVKKPEKNSGLQRGLNP